MIIEITILMVFLQEAGMSAISLQGRSVLGLKDFTAEEIERILQVAAQMKKIVLSGNKKKDFLRGKSIVTVFSEASTRTRSSFELAGKYLGADVINITKSGSSMTKGESMRDTLLTVSAMGVDAVIIRDSSEGAALFASKVMSPKVKVPVVLNAGDGAHAHPSQALLELFTLKEAGKNIKGMKYVIIGDILHSRVARSDIYGFTKLGAEVHLVGPRTLVPKELESMGCIVDDDLETALKDADAINILRIQLERAAAGFIPTTREYARLFGINKKRLALCKPDPGPMNRGIEIGYDVAYDESSWIQEEVRNGVAVRMALEYLTLTEGKDIDALN
jgi:aspartate carbamoyltransferase catalytic subunit